MPFTLVGGGVRLEIQLKCSLTLAQEDTMSQLGNPRLTQLVEVLSHGPGYTPNVPGVCLSCIPLSTNGGGDTCLLLMAGSSLGPHGHCELMSGQVYGEDPAREAGGTGCLRTASFAPTSATRPRPSLVCG